MFCRLCSYIMAPDSSSIVLCLLVFGMIFWFPHPVLRSVAVQFSDSSLEPLLVKLPRNHAVLTAGITWSIWLSLSQFSFFLGCSGTTALSLPCDVAAWSLRRNQTGQELTRTLLYVALRARSPSFFAQVPSQARQYRRKHWRAIRRAVEQRDKNAYIGRECYGVLLRSTRAGLTGFALARFRGHTIRQSRSPRVPHSGSGMSVYCTIGDTSTRFPYVESLCKRVTYSWSSAVGATPLDGVHVFSG